MDTCPVCSGELPGRSRFCPSCGEEQDSTLATQTKAGRAPRSASPSPSPSPSPSVLASATAGMLSSSTSGVDGRFVPGTILGGRYRIVGLVGRGGMGEVYRADDLMIGHPVALKLLPEELAADRGRITRLLGELRVARQVSHPNVCRVYDVAELDGHLCMSMEYVDGEDLAALLRRIGHLPRDKAVQIARQLCAGLHAAHDRGILHRDLKPSNVMIDGQGRVRITDFGLAGVIDEFQGDEVRVGTPAYMAPEQVAGTEVTVRSDVYALGLVLYELFTGKKAFRARTLAELTRMRSEGPPPSPSSLVEQVDPAVERVILRCLERDPGERPPSALAVAAGLPGGDPLADVLAAGETPSPEMVAAAGEYGGLATPSALAWVGAIVLCLAAFFVMNRDAGLPNVAPVDKSAPVLRERAAALLDEIGYGDDVRDRSWGFAIAGDYMRHLRLGPDEDRWAALSDERPSPWSFWYRTSTRPLVSQRGSRVSWDDPSHAVSGMAGVVLDDGGRLLGFQGTPPQVEEDRPADEAASPPAWELLFAAADLDIEAFEPAEPRWVPEAFADARVAWTGTYPGSEPVDIRVEAASYRGVPVEFRIIFPWTRPERSQASPSLPLPLIVIGVVFFFLVVSGTVLLARRNLRAGRGDPRGAFRLALVLLAARLGVWVLAADHTADLAEELTLFVIALGQGLFFASIVGLMYLALEPYLRRYRPDTVITWTRLLGGRLRDPLVGRDLLIGGTLGAFFAAFSGVVLHLYAWTGNPPSGPSTLLSPDTLLGSRQVAAELLAGVVRGVIPALQNTMILVIVFVIVRGLLLALPGLVRRRWGWTAERDARVSRAAGWLAAAFLIVVTTAQTIILGDVLAVDIAVGVVQGALFLFALFRFGLLATTTAYFSMLTYLTFPMTLDPGKWYAGVTVVGLLWALLPAALGLGLALSGRPAAVRRPETAESSSRAR